MQCSDRNTSDYFKLMKQFSDNELFFGDLEVNNRVIDDLNSVGLTFKIKRPQLNA